MKCPKCNLTLNAPEPEPGEIAFPVPCPACDSSANRPNCLSDLQTDGMQINPYPSTMINR